MDNLKKGGRVGNAKALLATALSIKPIIAVEDGVVEQYGRQRTRSKALKFLVDKVAAASTAMEHLAVLHADCDDVEEFVAQLRPFYPGDIVVGQIGPVVGAHAGLGTIGVAYQDANPDVARRAVRQAARARTAPPFGRNHPPPVGWVTPVV